MNEEIRKKLQQHVGDKVELKLKTGEEFTGKIVWISPDRCMVEIECNDGIIKTLIHDDIKRISCAS